MKITVFPGVFSLAVLLAILAESKVSAQAIDSFDPAPNNDVYTSVPAPDGSIVVGGSFSEISGQAHRGLGRLFQDGSLDISFTNFITKGMGSMYARCLAVQTNGQMVIGGAFTKLSSSPAVCVNSACMNPNDTMDTEFDAAYTNVTANTVNCLVVQPDGKIIVSCSDAYVVAASSTLLYRLNRDGSLDTNFNVLVNNNAYSVALQTDGKLLVVGNFTAIDNQSMTNLARLNADGSLDAGFQPPGMIARGSSHWVNQVGGVALVQPDGKIVVGGIFDNVNGQAHTNIVRLNADGSVDTNFNAQADSSACYGVQSLVLQANGKIIVGHDSATFDGVPAPALARLNPDGTLDQAFKPSLESDSVTCSAVLQADGKILVGGLVNTVGSQPRSYLCRLINTEPATQSLTFDGTNIIWLRGGASPEVWRTSFESSTDGTNWIYLGDGARISGGWAISNVVVSAGGQIRARGFTAGGQFNGSSWFVEAIYPQTPPQFVTSGGNFGCPTNQFGCSLIGSVGSTVEIDSSTNLTDWAPLGTNFIYEGPCYFSDPASTNLPQRFYRLRLQQGN